MKISDLDDGNSILSVTTHYLTNFHQHGHRVWNEWENKQQSVLHSATIITLLKLNFFTMENSVEIS